MTKEREALKLALEALENNRQTHHYCEDTWYSCPKHEDGCANESEGDECNCGADKANAEIDKAITAIKEALAQPERLAELGWQEIECPICGGGARAFPKPEQEPVAIADGTFNHNCPIGTPLYTAPAHQNVNVDDIGVPVGVGGWLTTTSSQPEHEPVAWMHTKIDGVVVPHRPADLNRHPDRWTALYKDPKPCPTCEALARTVMLDQTSHDATPPQRKPLTDEEIERLWPMRPTDDVINFARAIEAAHGIKGEA